MAFNKQGFSASRDRNSRPRGGGFRPRFGGREDRGPVEMHSAVCDNCGRECEVPFRPTSGKPVYCSNCFENQRGGSDSGRFERRSPERSENGFAEINAKLDDILRLLEDKKPEKKTKEKVAPIIEE